METKKLSLSKISYTQNYRAKDQDVSGLMQSISENGLLQPIVVSNKKNRNGKHELIAGYRRFAAIKKLGLKSIPITFSEINKTLGNLVENIQREQPETYELGRGMHDLITKKGMTEKEVGVRLGVSAKHVKQHLDIFKLIPAQYRKAVKTVKGRTGRRPKSYIPSGVAHTVLRMNKDNQIDKRTVTALLKRVYEDPTITNLNIKKVAHLMAAGKTSKIKEELESVRNIVVNVQLDSIEIMALENKCGGRTAPILKKYLMKNIKKIRREINSDILES